jgi:hypothetical protein
VLGQRDRSNAIVLKCIGKPPAATSGIDATGVDAE